MVIDFLPDDHNLRFVYDQGPWWCMVHHLMQAVSVLLLGLSFPASSPQDGVLLTHYVKKAILWLSIIQDPVAERAYQVALSTFEAVSRRHTVDVLGLWKTDPVHEPNVNHGFDPNMMPYAALQYSPSGPVATYSTYDTVSTGATFPIYTGTSTFIDNYHIGR